MTGPIRARATRAPGEVRSGSPPSRQDEMLPADRNPPAIDVVVVTSPGCHLCEQAKELLDRLTSEYPLALREVDIESVRGKAIIERHRIAFPPVLILNGRLHGYGECPSGNCAVP